jgi:hypothetical protein
MLLFAAGLRLRAGAGALTRASMSSGSRRSGGAK